MPEGPEIRRAADRLAAVLVDAQLEQVEFAFPHLAPHAAALAASRVQAVEPRSKALLTRFACGLVIYSHNQLYGVWKIVRRGQAPATSRSLRLALRTTRHEALLYSASEIEVLSEAEVAAHPYIARLGPDPLARGTGLARIRRQLLAPRFQRRQLADLLLDQAFVAGVGNYLRSEILFRAGLRPERRLAGLDAAERAALAGSVLDTCRRAYRHAGVTVDLPISRRVRQSRRQPGPAWQEGPNRDDHHRFWVFERAGFPCHRCGDAIARSEYGGRRVYWCGRCQT